MVAVVVAGTVAVAVAAVCDVSHESSKLTASQPRDRCSSHSSVHFSAVIGPAKLPRFGQSTSLYTNLNGPSHPFGAGGPADVAWPAAAKSQHSASIVALAGVQ